jgi:transposase
MTTMTDPQVVVGVDTHRDFHVAACVDGTGKILGTISVSATGRGYGELLRWARRHGEVRRIGIEGTGSYGAGLARHAHAAGIEVLDVCRPDRQVRRRLGKSDPIDAEMAAHGALSGYGCSPYKAATAAVEGVRALRTARRSAVKNRTQALNQLRALVVTAPEPLRARLHTLTAHQLARTCARMRPVGNAAAMKLAMVSLGRRVVALEEEAKALEAALASAVADAAPKQLLESFGVGTDVAAAMLIAVGENPDRLRSERSFAALCGSCPVEASSGRTHRHRLSRGGDRQANNALWRIVMVRLSFDPRTRAYMDRRLKEGLSRKEVIRCLKRYVAREIYACFALSA